MAWICDKNGNHKCEVKKLSYNGVFMEVSSITVTIESPAPIDFAIGDYIDWDYDGLRYTLDTAAGVEKQARRNSIGDAFVYENLVFLSPLRAAENADFFDVILGNTNDFLTNTEFSFYGTAWDYAKRLEANLCRLNGAGSWKVRIWTGGTCYDETPATNLDTGSWENKLVDVSGIKCLAGFQQIYDLWGCAYVFSVVAGVNYVDFYDDFEQYAKAWSVGGEEKIFAYGKGNGLYKIRHTQDTDHVLVTRLRPYGSGENLPTNYYLNSSAYHVDGNESSELAISRLMLPASQWTKDGVKHPSNAYLEQNTELYGVREGVVVWDGSDEELGEIKPTVRGLTIQDLLALMAQGDAYRPVEAKWPDTSQRIDKIITGAAPVDNGAVAEAGYDFTVVESSGSFSEHAFGLTQINRDVEFNDIVMGVTPSVSHLAEYRIVPTSANKNVVSFDVTDAISGAISGVTAYINPYVNGVKVEDAMYPCEITEELIHETIDNVTYTKRYNIGILDSAGNPIVFSTTLTGAVTFRIVAHIEFLAGSIPERSFGVIRDEHAVTFNMLRGNKAIDNTFAVTIPQVGFDLSAAVSGSARLCMRSGANQPREFAIVPSSVKYLEDSDTWYMQCKRSIDKSTSTRYPNSDAVISAGDEYYLSGIAMPSLYVEIAAQKLLSASSAWLAIHSKPRMLSAVDVDNKIMAEEGIVLKEGMSLPISDVDLGINPANQESRVIDNIRIEEGTDAVRTFSVTLRDKKEKSSLNAAIRGATKDLATNASVNDAVSASIGTGHGSLTGRDLPNQHPISAITGLEEKLASILFFEKDGNGNVKLKDEYGGLWTHGFLTAGGLGSGGGGSTLDLDRMWQSLTNAIADSHASDKIAVDHIPIVVKVGTTSYNPASTGVISLPAYPTTLPASDVYAWAKAASKPSYAFSEITGSATAGQLPSIENLTNFATKVYDASASRTKNTVLAAPNGSNGAATFRALVAADIPSLTTGKISDLETWIGNKGFVTKAVNDLTYYYTKSDTYTKTEVNSLIAAIDQFHYEIAASTSAVTNPQSNVLYLIGPTGSGADKYEEYVYPNSTTGWVKIGETTIDLSGYVNSVVASGSGNYVSGFSKSGNTLTLTMGTLPTSLPASDVYAWAKAASKPSYSFSEILSKPTTLSGYGITDASFGTAGADNVPITLGATTKNVLTAHQALPTSLKNPYALTFGSKTYDGSAAKEITAEDLGALTSHQSIYALTIKDSAGTTQLTYAPNSAVGSISLTKDMVGLGNVDNTADANKNVATAVKLANPRSIWGRQFDGSANVTGALTGVTSISASGVIIASQFKKLGGSASQFLKANGSVDSNEYALLSELSTSELVLSGGIANVAARIQSIEEWMRFPALDNLEIDDTLGADTVRANNAYADIFHATTGVVSDGYVTAGAAASSSDARLKDNIQAIPFDKALSILNALRGVEWEWSEKKALLSGKHGSGLVAQEVERFMPWAVLDFNGELSLNYNSLWGVAIPAMQSHEQRIQQLEAENKALREELETIKAR